MSTWYISNKCVSISTSIYQWYIIYDYISLLLSVWLSLLCTDKKLWAFVCKCEQIGAEIFKRALSYPTKLIARNAGVNGNVVVEKVGLWTSAYHKSLQHYVLEALIEI